MLGFAPVPPPAAAAADPALAEVNARLGAYEAAWDAAVDSWLVIRIGDPQVWGRGCCVLLCNVGGGVGGDWGGGSLGSDVGGGRFSPACSLHQMRLTRPPNPTRFPRPAVGLRLAPPGRAEDARRRQGRDD
jgi:hypothetical protein